MTIRTLLSFLMITTTLTVAGCDDSGGDKTATKAATKAEGPKKASPTPSSADGGHDEAGADGGDEAADDADGEYAGFDPRVVKAAKVARSIEDAPTDADTVLASNGLDRDGLDSLMFEIARDPELTGQYRIARGL